MTHEPRRLATLIGSIWLVITVGTFGVLIWKGYLGGGFIFSKPPRVTRVDRRKILPVRQSRDQLIERSYKMKSSAADELAGLVSQQPLDADKRATLMYFAWAQHRSERWRRVHAEQLCWFVANFPDAECLEAPEASIDHNTEPPTYALIRDLYDNALRNEPRNKLLIANAAEFMFLGDQARSIELRKQATTLDPNDPRVWDRYAFILTLASRGFLTPSGPHLQNAAEAYAMVRRLGQTPETRYFVDAAIETGHLNLAMAEGKGQLASKNRAEVHAGHRTLGLVYVAQHDIAAAKEHLLDSIPKTEAESSDDYRLAKKLYDNGEHATVLDFFKQLQTIAPDQFNLRMKSDLQAGRDPTWDPFAQ